jgi:hypothetical protein
MSALTGVFEEHNNNYRCSRLFVHVSLEGREEKDDRMEVALRQDGAADESTNDECDAGCAAQESQEQCTLHNKRSSPRNDNLPRPAKKKRKQRRLAHVVAVPAEARVVHAVSQKKRRTVDHTYRDYSQVPPPADYAGEPVEISRMSFVEIVHHMLSQGSLKGYIWWLPHGRAFKLCDFPLLEESKILNKYFEINRASTFVLMLRSYGFKQLTSRKDKGSFFHEVSVFGEIDSVPDHHLCTSVFSNSF